MFVLCLAVHLGPANDSGDSSDVTIIEERVLTGVWVVHKGHGAGSSRAV